MKKQISIFVISLISILLTCCGAENSSEIPTKDLIKYTIHKEDITDIPIKTQISLEVIVQNKEEISKDKLQELLIEIYENQINRTGFKHHKTPNVVYIYAYTSKELANGGMGQWVAMLSKMRDEDLPEFKLNDVQFNSLSATTEERWGLTQDQRHEIWDKIIHAERDAQAAADRKYPMDKAGLTKDDLIKNGEYMTALKQKREEEIAKEYDLNAATLDSIGIEGIMSGWPFPQ